MINRILIALSFALLVGSAQAQPVTNTLGLSQAALTYRSINVSNTALAVKNSTAILCGYYLHCARSSTCFFKFFNARAADVVVGTTQPKLTFPLPAGASANMTVECNRGIGYTTGISLACTTGVADTDTAAPNANECVANLYYK